MKKEQVINRLKRLIKQKKLRMIVSPDLEKEIEKIIEKRKDSATVSTEKLKTRMTI